MSSVFSLVWLQWSSDSWRRHQHTPWWWQCNLVIIIAAFKTEPTAGANITNCFGLIILGVIIPAVNSLMTVTKAALKCGNSQSSCPCLQTLIWQVALWEKGTKRKRKRDRKRWLEVRTGDWRGRKWQPSLAGPVCLDKKSNREEFIWNLSSFFLAWQKKKRRRRRRKIHLSNAAAADVLMRSPQRLKEGKTETDKKGKAYYSRFSWW